MIMLVPPKYIPFSCRNTYFCYRCLSRGKDIIQDPNQDRIRATEVEIEMISTRKLILMIEMVNVERSTLMIVLNIKDL